MGTLYVVTAPAGDPNDLTRRALRILEKVSFIVADDEGNARQLLDYHGLATPLAAPADSHLDTLAEGDVAFLCSGLFPAPSESGHRLIRGALDRGYPVVPAPGPSLSITALVISGLPADSFVFLGELPGELAARSELVALVSAEHRTLLALAPRALLPAALADLYSTLGDRPSVLVVSSSMGAQVLWRGRLEDAARGLDQAIVPGTHVLVVGGAPAGTARWDEGRLRSEIQSLQVAGLGAKQISQQLAGNSGWSRREVYRLSVESAQGASRKGKAMRTENETELYPLKFQPLPKEKVWGGTRIAERFGQAIPAGRPIGEVWLVWDQLLVSNGAFRGQTLAELVRHYPVLLLGPQAAAGQDPIFPLLIKILDANDTLSVQVHPDDRYAQEYEGEPFGKAEVWLVLDTDPEARLIHGVKHSLTRAAARRAIEAGSLEDELDYVEVAPGDVIMVAPGAIHALGGGILLYELQQSSDLTYRLYDWDRRDPGRPLHIDKALDVARLDPFATHKITPIEVPEPGGVRVMLCACERFAAELLRVRSSITERPAGVSFHALTVLKGEGLVCYGARLASQVELRPGESVLVPASIGEYEIHAGTDAEPLEVVKAYVPHSLEEIAAPLRNSGISDEAVHQLGGEPGS